MNTNKPPTTHRVGSTAPCAGTYICVPCGYKRNFDTGERFPACTGCMNISHEITEGEFAQAQRIGLEIDEFASDLVAPNLETWELVKQA